MSNTRGCPKNSNIRPMYSPTTYFNKNYPDLKILVNIIAIIFFF